MIQKLKLGNVEYPVRWSFNALIKMEEMLGESPFVILQDQARISSPSVMRTLVFCGLYGGATLSGEEFTLTEEQVGNLMNFEDIEKYVELFSNDIMSQTKKKSKVVDGVAKSD